MKTHARVVIVGGGIVGVSAAYHLAQQGWGDVVVLDAASLELVARVHMPRRVPFGFHGSFLPDAT